MASKKKQLPKIGGTAVPGARSLQEKQVPETSDPQQQQYASYNRDMRRRMQAMGTAPEQQGATSALDKRKKQKEKRDQKLAEMRKEVVKKVPHQKTELDKRAFLFPLITGLIIVGLIVAFLILRATHVI